MLTQPMIYMKRKFEVDMFTDNEIWTGKIYPSQALYLWLSIFDTKLIVCGMCSNSFTIADLNHQVHICR